MSHVTPCVPHVQQGCLVFGATLLGADAGLPCPLSPMSPLPPLSPPLGTPRAFLALREGPAEGWSLRISSEFMLPRAVQGMGHWHEPGWCGTLRGGLGSTLSRPSRGRGDADTARAAAAPRP